MLLLGWGGFAGVFAPTAALAAGGWAEAEPAQGMAVLCHIACPSPVLTAFSSQMFLNKLKSKTRSAERREYMEYT